MIELTPIVSRSKTKPYKCQKKKKLALNSRIQTYQILSNNDEVCIPSLSIILLAVPVFYDFLIIGGHLLVVFGNLAEENYIFSF